MHIDTDILILAIVAVALIWRLWSVLGTRNENDPLPPAMPPVQAASSQTDEPFTPRASLPPPPLPPTSLAGGLQQVKAIDPSFDEKRFLEKARAVFTAVIAAYAAGDMESITGQVTPELLAHFQQAAEARKAQGQTAQTRILSITEAEPISARAEGPQAYVTVKFVSAQENILRDRQGTVIGGEVGKTEDATDIWTFSRDTAMPDAQWILTATHGS